MAVKVRTNRVPRDSLESITEEERKKFDWLPKEETIGFFRFHGEVYHLSQFERYQDDYWHGVYQTSMTTGMLVRVEKNDQVIVGTYLAFAGGNLSETPKSKLGVSEVQAEPLLVANV